MGQDLALWQPSTTLSIEQESKRSAVALRYATSPQEALRQAKKLVAAWPHANPPNPAGWAASLGAVLEQYPLGVVEDCCDVRVGLAREREFPPTPAAVIGWCDKRLAYHRGMVKWGKQWGQQEAERQFSDEHRQGMLERMRALLHGLFDRQPAGSER